MPCKDGTGPLGSGRQAGRGLGRGRGGGRGFGRGARGWTGESPDVESALSASAPVRSEAEAEIEALKRQLEEYQQAVAALTEKLNELTDAPSKDPDTIETSSDDGEGGEEQGQ